MNIDTNTNINHINNVPETCIVETANRFNLPKNLLIAILKTENGEIGKTNSNSNGSFDIGPMQINSIWLPHFSEYVTLDKIKDNGCINMQVGAWILRHNINKANGNTWEGVGNYHSTTPHLHQNYVYKVFTAYYELENTFTK